MDILIGLVIGFVLGLLFYSWKNRWIDVKTDLPDKQGYYLTYCDHQVYKIYRDPFRIAISSYGFDGLNIFGVPGVLKWKKVCKPKSATCKNGA